jgi:hypothetical protein
MDYKEPKTRQEKKGNKNKEGKGVYNQKTIRLKENMMNKRDKSNDKTQSDKNQNDKTQSDKNQNNKNQNDKK